DSGRFLLTATNLETTIIADIGAKVELPGRTTVPAKTFNELINKLSQERIDLRLDTLTETLFVRCGISNTHIRCITADEFPPSPNDDNFHTLLYSEDGAF